MMNFVPMEKRSKKAQREWNKSQRGTWGPLNPVTRTVPNKKAFSKAERNRTKASCAAYL